MTDIQPIHIGILQYPGAQESTILGLRDIFTIANQLAKKVKEQLLPALKVSIINLQNTIDYTDIAFLKTYHQEKYFSVLIIPPAMEGIPSISTNDQYIKFLQLHHQKGTILTSVCTGVFLLAKTGLLKSRPVTTHWKYSNIFQQLFPETLLQLNKLLVNDQDIITTSGGICWMDLGMCLIKRFFGPIVAAEISNAYLWQPYEREQSHYCIFHPRFHHGDPEILKVQHWIKNTKIKKIISLKELALIATLKTRTLQRRFLKATGMNITEYLQRYRIHQSQIFLQYTEMPIYQVAHNVGYYDDQAFSKIFTRLVGLKPTRYRQMFSVI